MVIFNTNDGLYHVDIYFSSKSKTNIRQESIFLHGNDNIPRGDWILDVEAKTKDDPKIILDFLICMSFIANRENHGRKPVDETTFSHTESVKDAIRYEAEETTAIRLWSFIGIKMIVRQNIEFLDFLFRIYEQKRLEYFSQMKHIDTKYDMSTLTNILDELLKKSDTSQVAAIEKIKGYAGQVGRLYLI